MKTYIQPKSRVVEIQTQGICEVSDTASCQIWNPNDTTPLEETDTYAGDALSASYRSTLWGD